MNLQHNSIALQEKKPASVEKLIIEVTSLPFWVKQYIYFNLKDNLIQQIDANNLDDKSVKDLIQTFVPSATSIGRMYIKRNSYFNIAIPSNISQEQIEFLNSLEVNRKLIEICNEKQWSLMKCCKILVECIEKNLVNHIDNNNISNTVLYLAGKIKLGEYLLRMNKISLEQVEKALYTQKEIKNQLGTQTKLGELLVNLGFISESDKNDILLLKENSDIVCDLEDETQILKDKIEQLNKTKVHLSFENEGLKQDVEDYQQILIEKATMITELKQKLENLNKKKPFPLCLFQKLNYNRS